QPLVQENVGVRLERPPFGELTWLQIILRGANLIVQIMARLAGAQFAILREQRFQFVEMIRCRAEMAEILAPNGGPLQCLGHVRAVIGMKGVAFDEGGARFEAVENALERQPRRGGAGAGRTSYRNYWVCNRHNGTLAANASAGKPGYACGAAGCALLRR